MNSVLSRTVTERLSKNSAPYTSTIFKYYRGRVALYAILRGLGIGHNDEVAIQGFTCEAVPEGVIRTGAQPVYIDIEPFGLNMDPRSLRERITPKTRAIIIQHTFGIPAQIDQIMRIANEANIPVVEDCCHNLGSQYNKKMVGSYGVASFYSFEWGKPCVAGLGGAAVVNNSNLSQRMLQQYSQYKQPPLIKQLKIEIQYHAFNLLYWPRTYWPIKSAFHSLSKVGVVEGNFLPQKQELDLSPDFEWRISQNLNRRIQRKSFGLAKTRRHAQEMASLYTNIFKQTTSVPIKVPQNSNIFYARFPLITENKTKILALAKKNRIELADWYRTVVHPLCNAQLKSFQYDQGSCPEAEARAEKIISLPTHTRANSSFAKRTSILADAMT